MSNTLKYTNTRIVGGRKISVKVRLSDDCRNGHADFAITADIYEKNNQDCWKLIKCGCCHDEIAVAFPELCPFIPLHLCDAKGVPMFAQANGFYHLWNSTCEITMKELRITRQEYNRFLSEAEDHLYFTYLLQVMGIPKRWEKEACAAIKLLEEFTGETFEDTSVRYQFTPLTPEDMQLVKSRLAEGYYLPENIKKRKRDARFAVRRQKIADLKAAALRKKQKIDRELQVELYLFKLGASLESFIYYDYSNEVAFNWMHRICDRERMSEEQYNALMAKIDYSKLPEGITFKFKLAT